MLDRLKNLGDLETRAERFLKDQATIQIYTPATDDLGNPGIPTYPDGNSYACAEDPATPSEVLADTDVAVLSTQIWFPLSAESDLADTNNRIKITHRNGTALATPRIYEIEGPARRREVVLWVLARSVTT